MLKAAWLPQGSVRIHDGGRYRHLCCMDFEKAVREACLTARSGPAQESYLAENAGSEEAAEEDSREVVVRNSSKALLAQASPAALIYALFRSWL
jgi:hypothetical protein